MSEAIRRAKERMHSMGGQVLGEGIWKGLLYYSMVIRHVLCVLLYYSVGVGYYTSKEGWTVTNTVYFITEATATIGYGDFHPTTDSSRLFTCFYLIVGIIVVLTAVDDFTKHAVLRAQNSMITRLYPRNDQLERCMRKIAISMVGLLVLALVGMTYFVASEEWTAIRAFYWTVCTMTTVGFGDLDVTNDSTRLFSIFFIASCVVTYATTIYNLQELYSLATGSGTARTYVAGDEEGEETLEMSPLHRVAVQLKVPFQAPFGRLRVSDRRDMYAIRD
ncbi:hypothetical protein B484DRAFT_214706 [Ochromonadaceae sp. CCMP2298]|nr:hypothetical protein B484DRAFT_214706 [Ochromonadaceae sp. CCMP2298]